VVADRGRRRFFHPKIRCSSEENRLPDSDPPARLRVTPKCRKEVERNCDRAINRNRRPRDREAERNTRSCSTSAARESRLIISNSFFPSAPDKPNSGVVAL